MTRTGLESLERRRLLADIASLTLINAQTDQPVAGFETLRNGAVIDLAVAGRQLSILANVGTSLPATWSVRFNYDGSPNYKMENVGPYAIAGDAKGGTDFLPWTPTLGTHTLIVTPYDKVSGTGIRGSGKILAFEVVDTSLAPAAPKVGPSLIADPLRVNAGGPVYADKAGHVFAADIGFSASVKSTSIYAVGNTLDDPLYHSRRYAKNFSFSRATENGVYTLTLHFAEPTMTAANKRVFDVSAEGQLIVDNLDLFATAGAKKALVKSFEVTVLDGKIDVAFAASVNNAIISAIELAPGSPPPPPPPPPPPAIAVPAPVYIDAGGSAAFTDSAGRVFQPDSYFTGGAIGQVSGDVSNTFDDALFRTYRSGPSFTFSKAVANGHYTLFLEFADPQSTGAGQRKFDVFAEGALALDDFDIFADAVPNPFETNPNIPAVAKRVEVTVTDNKLDLSFVGVVGDAMVSAIALIPTDVPPYMIPYAGISDYADPTLHEAIMTAYKIRSQSNLRHMGQGILLYSNDFKGKYPADLEAMAINVDVTIDVFANPRVPVLIPRGNVSHLEVAAFAEAQREYVYVGKGLNNTAGDKVVVVYENPDIIASDKLSVLWGDGHVSEVPRDEIVSKYGGSATIPSPLPRPTPTFGDQRIVESQTKLRKIARAMQIWANQQKSKLPPDMGTLYLAFKGSATFGLAPTDFINPRGKTPPPPAGLSDAEIAAWINANTDYIFPAPNVTSYKAPVWVYENPAEMPDGINIVFADGHVEFREMRWALESVVRAKGPGVA